MRAVNVLPRFLIAALTGRFTIRAPPSFDFSKTFPPYSFLNANVYVCSMSPLSSPPIAQSRIPKVKELYESLGFGSAFKRPTADLAESTHSWRKEYITHDSIPGRDLRDWKSLSTRNDLEQMAAEFVKDGRGEKHWPLKGCESPRLIPEYPLDKYK